MTIDLTPVALVHLFLITKMEIISQFLQEIAYISGIGLAK
jgi:hypothetical protein